MKSFTDPLPISDTVYTYTLTGSTAKDIVIPAGAKYAKFKSTVPATDVFYLKNGATAILPGSVAAEAGYQTAKFIGGTPEGADPTGLAEETAGYATVTYPIQYSAAHATGLVGATTYTATITVDGAPIAISVLGSAAQTFGELVDEIQTDLSTDADITFAAGVFTVTSATTGVASTVLIEDSGAVGLFGKTGFASTAGYQIVYNGGNITVGGATGLANDATAYTATITVDGVAKSISVVGSAAQTFVTLKDEINTDLGASATASITSNRMKVTSASVGHGSTVSIVDTGANKLFQSTTRFVNIQEAHDGKGPTFDDPVDGTAQTYTMTVTVDGDERAVSVVGDSNQTFTALVASINTDIAGTAGTQIVNVGGAKVGGSATGLANDATAYTATITVDGVGKNISVVGSAAQTYTTLLSEITTDLAAAATIVLSGGNLLVTSATTGGASTVAIVDVDLFATLTGFVAILAAVAGLSEAVATLADGGIKFTSDTTGNSSSVLVEDTDLLESTTGFDYLQAAVVGNVGRGPTLNPDVVKLDGVGTISLISAGTPTVSVSFYS